MKDCFRVYSKDVQEKLDSLQKEINIVTKEVYSKYKEDLNEFYKTDIIAYESLLEDFNLELDLVISGLEKELSKLMDNPYEVFYYANIYHDENIH